MRADQFIVIKPKLDTMEGREAGISGEDLQDTLVEPKYAKVLNPAILKRASMGERANQDQPVNGERLNISLAQCI